MATTLKNKYLKYQQIGGIEAMDDETIVDVIKALLTIKHADDKFAAVFFPTEINKTITPLQKIIVDYSGKFWNNMLVNKKYKILEKQNIVISFEYLDKDIIQFSF